MADAAADATDATDATDAAEADEADLADETDDELNELVVAKNLHVDKVEKISKITVHLCYCWRPFSLTKSCAIFLKDKGYFCPIANNNQLGGRAMGFNRQNCWISLSSLRMQRIRS